MKKNNLLIPGILAGIIILLIIAVFYFVNKTKQKEKEIAEVVEMMSFDKQQVEKEFEDLTTEFDGYTSTIRNDSIFKLLEKEKTKVQQLLDELRITKSTNSRRIAQLRAELATVRKIMVHYVNQIDSLNAENKVLKTENKEVKRKFQEASQTVDQLSKEKETLNETVNRAAKLDVSNFSMTPLNNRNRKVGLFSQIANLQFNYTIAKNITASPGNKTIYLRIMRPDDEVLTKSPSNVFHFENKEISYSAKKDFEYEGENLNDVLYWKVEEIIQPGTYRADFFIDGNRTGSFQFVLKK
ncbi:MAG TPA: hypothetical protein P5084_02970 [Paludibacter sp.]|nr:hypothetical protein [Paludibacter sp.]